MNYWLLLIPVISAFIGWVTNWVAIKMLFTQDLNPDVVKRCGNEARILTDISPHTNVVNIYGVAVLPPR